MKYKLQHHHNSQSGTRRARGSFKAIIVEWSKKLVALGSLIIVLVIIYPRELHKKLVAFWDFMPSMPAKLGISVSEIEIEGLEKIQPEDIAHIINFNIGDNIYMIDLDKVRQDFENYPWIASATVERQLPSTIRITIVEERPRAVFIKDNERYFISESGKIIEKITDSNVGNDYIYLSGEGANLTYSDILDNIYQSEEIYKRIEGLVKIGQRRWDLKLKNNITLKLPQNDITDALAKFSKVIDDNIDFFQSGSIIDLRFMPEKIYIK